MKLAGSITLATGLAIFFAGLSACGDDSTSPLDAGRDGAFMTSDGSASTTDGSIAHELDAFSPDGTTTSDGSPSPSDAGNTTDGTPFDSGPPPFNNCTTFVDHTADTEVDLAWGFNITNEPDHCSIIKAGTTVVWTGDFTTHPLGSFDPPKDAGSPNNPLDAVIADAGESGPSISVTFTDPGLYGYHCMVHAFMQGGIEVVP